MGIILRERPPRLPAGSTFEGQAVDIGEAAFFLGFDTEQPIEEQGLLGDARFMMDEFFPPPRSIRLGMRLSF